MRPLGTEQLILCCLQRSFNSYMRLEHLMRHVHERHGFESLTDEVVRELLERMIAQGIVQKFDFDGHPSYRLCNGYKIENEPVSTEVITYTPVRDLSERRYFSIRWGNLLTPETIDAAPSDFDWDRAFDLDYLRERAEKNAR